MPTTATAAATTTTTVADPATADRSAAASRPVSAEEIRAQATPFLVLPNGQRVWRWDGDGFVRHEVHTHPGGLIEWTVWGGNDLLSARWITRDSAEHLIVRIRRSGADTRHANRALTAHGYTATQHNTLGACNCELCDPSPR